MKTKLKHCDGCNEEKVIWKNHEGNRYCKYCWATKKKPSKINQRSKKRVLEDSQYTKLRRVFLTKHPNCQAKLPMCTFKSTDVHHMEKRGINYLKTSSWLSCCRACHDWVEMNKKEARELGFLK
jgi:hypothetical protein